MNVLKRENGEKESKIFKLESQVSNMSEHLKTARQYQKMMSVLHEELILWEQRKAKLNLSNEKLNGLKQKIFTA